METSWGSLRPFWGVLGLPGALLDCLEGPGPAWGALVALLGASCGLLGALLGACWDSVGFSLGRLGALLGRLEALFRCFCFSRFFGLPTLENCPRSPLDRPKTAQEASKTAQESPKTAQEGCKTAQKGPKTAQEGLKTAQEGPKRTPRAIENDSGSENKFSVERVFQHLRGLPRTRS